MKTGLAWSCLLHPTRHQLQATQASPLASLLLRRSFTSPTRFPSLLSPGLKASICGTRHLSIRSFFPSTPVKTLDNLAEEADEAPTSQDAQLKYYSTYLALPSSQKTSSEIAKRIIERYEMQTRLWTSSSVSGQEATLLRSTPAWDAYLTALTNWTHPNVPSAGERVASASQRRDSVLAGTASPVASPTTKPELTNEQIVSAVMQDKHGSGSTARVIDQPTQAMGASSSSSGGYRGYSSAAAGGATKNEPIRVIVEEARGSLVLKMVRFLLTVAIYAFVVRFLSLSLHCVGD